MSLALRRMRAGEDARLYEVLRSAVIGGTTSHYDEAQRHAWAPSKPNERWSERLATGYCFVAVLDGLVVGFVSVTPSGYVDLVYVLPEFHGAGIGHRLLDRAEQEMRLTGIDRMTTDASLVAKPFFARHGWIADREDTVVRGGQQLPRVRMHKIMASQEESHAS